MKRSSQPLGVWFLAGDLFLTVVAWLLAYWLRFESGWFPIYLDVPGFDRCLGSLPLVLILALVSYRYAGQYEVTRLLRIREEMYAVGKGVLLSTLLIAAVTFALRSQYESRLAFILFAMVTFMLLVFYRRATWLMIGRLRARGYNQSHAIIVGTGKLARRTARSLAESSWMGIRTVGFIEDQPGTRPHDLQILGKIADLPRLVEGLHIEHVFIALPINRYAEARRVFDHLSQTIVDVRLVADIPALSTVSLTTSTLQGMTFIGLRESPYYGLNVVIKRSMDIFFSALALLLLSPLFLLLAFLVKRSSPGPIFYRQERCSLNGQTFMMLKFRTMRADAEVNGPQFTAENDPRRTRLGSFLRRTNLDELPQLINVLRGDMSLVGPRPERPIFVEKFQQTIPNYMTRHAVKCGITGWAQVNGWRGNSSLRKRVQFDLFYITHWNPIFDLRIMFLTVIRMILKRDHHAY